ncbi:MAG: universal stress protein [Cyclobacteriaceae bacterium]
MYSLKRVLVALDRSSHDEALFAYISKLASLMDLDVVYFLHVANDLNLPDEILAKYPDLVAPLDESIEKDIEYDIKKAQLPENLRSEILIAEGNTVQEVLKTVKKKEIDLLVLGRKSNEEANLQVVKKIVRSAPCSISIIPKFLPERLNKILVPVDFSENSLMSLQQAEVFSSKFPDLKVESLHIFDVPSGYSKIGKTYEEFSVIMEQNARNQFDAFLKKHPLNLPNLVCHFERLDQQHVPSLIFQFSVANNVDAIILGSRGRDSFSNFIMGSVAEGLIDKDQYWPLIVLKSKTDHFGIGEALMGI